MPTWRSSRLLRGRPHQPKSPHLARPNPRVAPWRSSIRSQRFRHEEDAEDGHVEGVLGDPSEGAMGLDAHLVRLHQNGTSKIL
jgi:hypothetical protein